MIPWPVLAVCASAAFALSQPAVAQQTPVPELAGRTFIVDDSGTVVLDPVLELQWQPADGTGGASPIVSASTRVSIQLNIAPWSGRAGRIYMNLPRTAGPTVRATWNTGGVLLPGSLVSGERAIVFAGAIGGPAIRDLIEIRLEADGSRLVEPESLAFGFEIEIVQ